MYLKNGVWTKGSPSKQKPNTPRVVTHMSQRSVVAPSTRRFDNAMQGKARICIKRSLGGLGDIIMATPIARGAKRKYPDSHVTYAVDTKYANGDLLACLENIPFIDEIVDYTLIDRDHFDIFADITRTGLSEERPYTIPPNRIDLFAQAAGIPLFGMTRPIYTMTEEERVWGKEFVSKALGTKKPKGIIAIQTRSNDPRRSWPDYRVREFITLARAEGYHCFIFEWGGAEIEQQWRLGGSTLVFNYKQRQAAAILEACDILVCPDSMMLHLGGALNMKCVSLFGAMPPGCRINHYPNCIAIVNQQLSCLGCIYSSCPNNFECMKSILPQAVIGAVKAKLSVEHVDDEMNVPEESISAQSYSVPKEIKTFAL